MPTAVFLHFFHPSRESCLSPVHCCRHFQHVSNFPGVIPLGCEQSPDERFSAHEVILWLSSLLVSHSLTSSMPSIPTGDQQQQYSSIPSPKFSAGKWLGLFLFVC